MFSDGSVKMTTVCNHRKSLEEKLDSLDLQAGRDEGNVQTSEEIDDRVRMLLRVLT